MQSEEQKIIKLIKSEDIENQNLGNLAMHSKITNENALYWYLATEPFKENITDDNLKKIELHLGFSSKKYALEQLDKIIEKMQKNVPHALTINLFFAKYNDYLWGIIANQWTKEDRIKTKKQIDALNYGKRFNTEPEQDL